MSIEVKPFSEVPQVFRSQLPDVTFKQTLKVALVYRFYLATAFGRPPAFLAAAFSASA